MTETPPEDPRDALIAEQAGQIAALTSLVAELREQLDAALRAASRNSGNSSMPPSTDDLPGRRPPARGERRAAERTEKKPKPGKQPGAPGSATSRRRADETVPHFPQGSASAAWISPAPLTRALPGPISRRTSLSRARRSVTSTTCTRFAASAGRSTSRCGRPECRRRRCRPAAVGDGGLPVGVPARPRRAGAGADRRPDGRRRVGRVRALVPGEGRGPGQGRGPADPHADRRRPTVAGFDETTLRSGPAGEKKYVHGAFTELYSAFYLGTRSLETMREAGILPWFAGIAVSDRYQNYFSATWEHLGGNQACAAHLVRDFADCAETYPGAGWPEQAIRALRGLIKAWHAAREQGLPAIPPRPGSRWHWSSAAPSRSASPPFPVFPARGTR